MNPHANNDSIKIKYSLTSVEKTEAPKDMPKGNWYHYVVMYGNSRINCVRAGTLKEVTQHAIDFVENLNARATMSYSNYATRHAPIKTE